MAIVAGIAIDKGEKQKFEMTVELINIKSGKDSKMTSKVISAEGQTLFDAARNIISLSGKKLYWYHNKVIIISKEAADFGLSKIMDWYNRDAETREDVNILISEGENAKMIFSGQDVTESIISLNLDKILKNQVSLSKSPVIDILKFDNEAYSKTAVVIPMVKLSKINRNIIPQVIGTAIIKDDKYVGVLDEEETKTLLYIRDEIQGGVLVDEFKENEEAVILTYEIFKNKTKIKPVVNGDKISFDLSITTIVAIDEILGNVNVMEEDEIKKLKEGAESDLKLKIESLVRKMQNEYKADIFGFGTKLSGENNKVYKSVKNKWEDVFKDININVNVKIIVKNSAVISKNQSKGE